MLYKFAKGLLKPIFKILYRVKITGNENEFMDGPCIYASNHKSMLDPLLMGLFVRRDLSYMSKKELFENKFIAWLFKELNVFPVDRKNLDISTVKTVLKILKNNGCIGIFPEGTRVFDGMADVNAKAGTGMFAVKGHARVIPVTIVSEYKMFKKTKVHIGKPISFEEYYGKKLSSTDYEKLSQEVLDIIRKNIELIS